MANLQNKIDKMIAKIEKKGWKPKLGHKLADLYYDYGDLDKAEEEYFKFMDATKSQDVPSFIFMKWSAERGAKMDLMASGPSGDAAPFLSFSPEEMMGMYEVGRESYLKKHKK